MTPQHVASFERYDIPLVSAWAHNRSAVVKRRRRWRAAAFIEQYLGGLQHWLKA